MKKIKFITTFSKNGYYVYGQKWLDSFVEFTKSYPHITSKVYIDGFDNESLKSLNYGPRVDIVDFNTSITNYASWADLFRNKSNHSDHNKNLAIKFSFKSFTIINELKNNNDCYVIWLDADSIFTSYKFDDFPNKLLNGNSIACQKESGSEHVESGIVIFDAEHPDTQLFLNKFENFYMSPEQFNSFGQFFDGYAIWRALNHTQISCVDLNYGYGFNGIQSDPKHTFMNPELRKRFYHNIGITGKRNYKKWEDYAKKDSMFQLIHGVNVKTADEIRKENLLKIKNKISKMKK